MSNLSKLSIFYGSETGNSEAIARQLGLEAKSRITSTKFDSEIEVNELNTFTKHINNSTETICIIICSSTGDGEPPENALKFDEYLENSINSEKVLSNLHFILLGMGDKTYDLTFGLFPIKIYNSLLRLGAKPLMPLSITDDDEGTDIVFEPWNLDLWTVLNKFYGKNKTINSINTKEVSLLNGDLNYKANGVNEDSKTTHGNAKLEETNLSTNEPEFSNVTLPANYEQEIVIDIETLKTLKELKLLPKIPIEVCQFSFIKNRENVNINKDEALKKLHSGLFQGKAVRVSSLSSSKAVKRILELEVEIPRDDIYYQPGDAFGIIQPNNPILVNKLVERLNLTSIQYDTLTLSAINGQLPSHLQPFSEYTTTIHQLISYSMDLTTLPKKALFRLLSQYCTDPIESACLDALSSKQGGDIFNSLREQSPNLLEILNIFPSCQPPLNRLLDITPAIQPRYYSVTTTPLNSPHKVEFIFNVVQYHTPTHNQLRHGLFTSFIDRESDLVPEFSSKRDLKIPLKMFLKPSTLNSFHLPTNRQTPLILVGPGTGLAPLLSFLRHRREQRRMLRKSGTLGISVTQELNSKFGKIWTVFGTRTESDDYFKEEELLQMKQDETIDRLDVTFSRDIENSFTLVGDKKIPSNCKYVQDALLNNQDGLFELMYSNQASFYLCGDASKMAKDVNDTLANILLSNGAKFDPPLTTIKEAQAILLKWTKEGRIKRDLW
ncbi:riboflavin synthase domain-like protein [Neoconidiobolus thromboides FSU 785]|nr:riboflavin synthase domain-like protein [Neoconidiobolus thromboides FSU 785]